MINLDKCSLDELQSIRDIVGDEAAKQKIDQMIRLMGSEDYLKQMEFRSDRLPNFKQEYFQHCQQLMLEFNVWSLPELWRAACFDARNNSEGNFYGGMFGFTKGALDEKWKHNLGYLAMLFQNQGMRRDYEGTYNTLNYVINGIYKEMDSVGKVDDVSLLFEDLGEREMLVQDRFTDVVEYLWQLREDVPGARLSVSNHGLTKNRQKRGKAVSISQKALMEADAFGCGADELESRNYEGAKRLIYVPREKFIIK